LNTFDRNFIKNPPGMKKSLFPAILLFLFVLSLQAQVKSVNPQSAFPDDLFGAKKEIVFSFHVSTIDEINNDLTNIISIDKVTPAANGGYDVRAYANKSEFSTFLTRNIPWQKVVVLSDAGKAYTMATTTAQMSTWDKYPTYSVYKQMMLDFATNYPSICKLDTILNSTNDGRQILVLKISDNVNATENEPRFLYSSSIHGDETTGYYLMLRMINYLLTNYGTNTKVTNLVNNVEIWICPLANPDGTYASGDNTISASASTRGNANGIDMNRNYPDPRAGNNPDGNSTQIETQAFMDFAAEHHFNMSANFHGGAEVVNYPWDTWTTSGNPNCNVNWWERVCTAFTDTARLVDATYLTDTYADGVTEGGDWYVITGGRQDFMNWFYQCREVTIELDDTKCTETQNLGAAWNRNYRSLLNYMQESTYGLRGIITDSCTGQPIKAKVWISSYDQVNDSSQVYSILPVGDYHKYLIAGTYNVTYSAPGYASKTVNNVVITNGAATVVNVAFAPALPAANFSANTTSTCTGVVNFSDLTTGGANTWTWNFGDGTNSSAQNPTHTYTTSGTYTVTLTASNCKGSNQMVKTSYITVNLPQSPSVTPGSHCGTGTVSLSATGTGTINWYNTPGGTLLGTGNTFTTPSISSTTTYYAEQEFATGDNVGKTDSVGGGAMYNTTSYYLKFTVTTACVLNSVKVYAGSDGNRTIALRNSGGTVLQSATVNIPAGESRVPLNFNLPVGTDLQLAITSSNPNLYRSTGGISFPYTIAGKLSITGTSATTTRYYFFYDWEVDKTLCTSAAVPVTATINPLTVASFTRVITGNNVAFTNTSTNATSCSWTFGDGQTSTQTNPSHTYTSDGTYNVMLITTNACGSDTAFSSVVISTVGGISPNSIANHISIYPNPANDRLYLNLSASEDYNCRFEIINMVGASVKSGLLNFSPSVNTASIDIAGLNAGVYFIKLNVEDEMVTRKIIVE
jgi:PKD repeat protein